MDKTIKKVDKSIDISGFYQYFDAIIRYQKKACSSYWTMIQNSDNQHDVFIVESHQKVYYYGYIVLDEIGSGVRPVINLLKSAIE